MASVQMIHVSTGIFMKYKPEAYFAAEHDEVFVQKVFPDDMTDADVKELEAMGWRFDPSLPAWRRFV